MLRTSAHWPRYDPYLYYSWFCALCLSKMAFSSYRKLSDDLEYYAVAYRTFMSRFARKGAHKGEWHASFVESDNMRGVLACLEAQEPLRILGVGSGTGKVDSRLISQLLKKHPTIHSTVVEPGDAHIQHYQTLASKGDLSGVTWEWHQNTWQEYWASRQSSTDAPKFHLIIAIHALYYVDDLKQSVLDLMSCLEEGGLLVIMMIASDSPFAALGRLIHDYPYTTKNTTNVAKLLEEHQVEYSETDVPEEVEVTECFEGDGETAEQLIDFFSHVSHFRKTAPRDVVTGFLDTLQEFTIKRGNRLFVDAGGHILIAKK